MPQQQLSPIGPGFQLNDSEHDFTPSWNGIPVVEIKSDRIFSPLIGLLQRQAAFVIVFAISKIHRNSGNGPLKHPDPYSPNSAKTATTIWFGTITQTCRRHGIDSFAYLQNVLTRLPNAPVEDLPDLFPHRWAAAQRASTEKTA